MSEPSFHQTRMGREFFEVTLPRLMKTLEQLNANLERLTDCAAASSKPPPTGQDANLDKR